MKSTGRICAYCGQAVYVSRYAAYTAATLCQQCQSKAKEDEADKEESQPEKESGDISAARAPTKD